MSNPYAPPRASVRDIADPTVAFELAERGTRFGGAMLDGLVFGVMVYAPLFLMPFMRDPEAAEDLSAGSEMMTAVGAGLAFVGFIIWLVLTVRYMKRNGQSIGKKLVNIKVVRTDGAPISFARLFWLRTFVNAAFSIIPLYSIIDVLFIFGEARRCLHDRIADTIVVKA